MKECPKCCNFLEDSCFYKNSRTPDGLAYACKECMSLYSKTYRKANKDKISLAKKQWYSENKDFIADYNKEYYDSNREQIISRVVQYRANKLKTDPVFKLQKNLRHRLSKVIKAQSSKIAIDFLGCSVDELKIHLESKFQEGMSWDNYGQWHIDHIKPLASFDLLNKEEQRLACHYTNLQPLWAKENLKKGVQ